MSVILNVEMLQRLAPSARSSYREAAGQAQAVLDRHGITANPLRLAHFLAQILHESGGLTVQVENLHYSAPRLPKVWPKRFQPIGALDPAAFAGNPEKLANEVYGGRNGNNQPGDGFLYRGRGLLQLTGRANYRKASTMLGRFDPGAPDFEVEPDLVMSAEWCLAVAAAVWEASGCNAPADADSITRVTQAINGGQIGIADRKDWLLRVRGLLRV